MTEHDKAILERPYAAGPKSILKFVGVLHERDKTFVCKVADDSADEFESVIKVVLDSEQSRLDRESTMLRRIRSPHVVSWLGKGKEKDRVWLQTEWLDGGNLARWMHKHDLKRQEEEANLIQFEASLRELLTYAADVCLGLQKLHDDGLVHTDVKPENICLVTKGYKGNPRSFAKLIDLGLAHEVRTHEGGLRPGQWAGSQDYAPLEMLNGDWGEVDARADIYSLGATLWTALTLRSPFLGVLQSTSMRQVGSLDTRALPLGLPPQLVELLKEMLEPEAKHRVQRIDDVYARLCQIIRNLDPNRQGYRAIDLTKTTTSSRHPAADMRDGQWDAQMWASDFVPLHPGSQVSVMRQVVTWRVYWALNRDSNFLKHEHAGNGSKPWVGTFPEACRIVGCLNEHQAFRGRRRFRLMTDEEWSALARVSAETGSTPRQRMLWWNERSRTVVPSMEDNEFRDLGEGPEWCVDEEPESPGHRTVRGTPLPDWFITQLNVRPDDDLMPQSLVVAAEKAGCRPEKIARLFFPQSWPKGRVRLACEPVFEPQSSQSHATR